MLIFLNRRRNYLKALLWDRTGFLLIAKRLEPGQFHIYNSGEKLLIERSVLRRDKVESIDQDVSYKLTQRSPYLVLEHRPHHVAKKDEKRQSSLQLILQKDPRGHLGWMLGPHPTKVHRG